MEDDISQNKVGALGIVTRFPPEPNGYLHLGHAKSICLNFGIARMYNGRTHMRLDDTNPETETKEFVKSILDDVQWLVQDNRSEAPWFGPVRNASDYFNVIYHAAEYLVQKGLAFVDHQSAGIVV
jgi:glutaminyl-tRNA synthetase